MSADGADDVGAARRAYRHFRVLQVGQNVADFRNRVSRLGMTFRPTFLGVCDGHQVDVGACIDGPRAACSDEIGNDTSRHQTRQGEAEDDFEIRLQFHLIALFSSRWVEAQIGPVCPAFQSLKISTCGGAASQHSIRSPLPMRGHPESLGGPSPLVLHRMGRKLKEKTSALGMVECPR